jgi:Ca2+-transporting ATPase
MKNQKPFYNLSIEQSLLDSASSLDGLGVAEAERRLKEFGENVLPAPRTEGIWRIFFRQFKSPLIYTLFLAAGLILVIGQITDSLIIALVLLINAVVGSIQEGRAQASLVALRGLAKVQVTVLRGGAAEVLDASFLVPGDVLILREGEQVGADCRVLESQGLMVNESMLTGESVPVAKTHEILTRENLPISEQVNMVFRGTLITGGLSRALVVSTGEHTVIGGISKALVGEEKENPLQTQIRFLSQVLILLVLFISAVLFFVGLLQGLPPGEIFAASVALAVSIIPEGLPVAVTVVLAGGVWRLSQRGALVRKLQAVEALAHTDILAVDKTGTITKNELMVSTLWTTSGEFVISGVGFDPSGAVLQDGVVKKIFSTGLKKIAIAGALVSDAELAFDVSLNKWKVVAGDPTDAAVQVMAKKLGVDRLEILKDSSLLETIPFDYQRKFHAVAYKVEGELVYVASGAPESIAELCRVDSQLKRTILSATRKMSAKGLRVIALASNSLSAGVLEHKGVLPSLKFLGLLGMIDQLHEGVQSAVQVLRESGIKTVMITGDTALTGKAMASEAGIFQKGDEILTGEELLKMSPRDLEKRLLSVSVFARIATQDKMNLIQAFGRLGKTVAMTGDGVNDAPALVAADLGVAMGGRGTAVAREAADIVLLDDNFSTIISAAEEGRGIYRTIQKVLVYLFSTSLAELVPIAGAVFLGFGLALSGAQIVWLNFVTDGFLTVALGLEPTEKLGSRLTLAKKRLLSKRELSRILWLGGVMGSLALFIYASHYKENYVYAQSLTLTFLAVVQWFNAWNCRSEQSFFKVSIFKNLWLILATTITVLLQVLAVYWGPLQKLLHTQSLSLGDWEYVVSLGLLIILADELWKLFFRKK